MKFPLLSFLTAFFATLLPLSGQLGGASEGSAPSRTLEELQKEIAVFSDDSEPAEKRYEALKNLVKSLSIDEMRTYLQGGRYHYTSEAGLLMVERWAFLDQREMLLWLQAEDQKIAELNEKTKPQKSTSLSLADGLRNRQDHVFKYFLQGWSRRDSIAAWDATKEPDGKLSELLPLNDDDGYGHIYLRDLIHKVAKVNPRKAWDEFRDFADRKYRWVFRESLLKGIVWGLPEDTDWEEALEQAIEYSVDDIDRVKWVIQEEFLSRWLPHDFAAAEKWFRSEKARAISDSDISFNSSTARFFFGSQVDPAMKLKMRISMRPAIVQWIAQDFERALIWLRERKGFVQELFSKEKRRLSLSVAPKKLRKIMAVCLSREEREAILSQYLVTDSILIGNPLEIFCRAGKKEEMRRSLGELKVSGELLEKVIQKIRSGHSFDDDE